MKTQLKIGSYIRVSTDKQAQVYEGSLDTQKYRMQEFVKNKNRESKGWGVIVEFYVDEQSAKDTRRPAYQKMMADIRSGKINLIMIADVSRLSRSVYDFGVLLRELEKYNASYLSMKEQFDTTTPAGRMMINMVVNMAQFEREQTSERVSVNCNSRALRGFVSGGRIPLGYDADKDRKGSYVINEKDAAGVKSIFNIVKEQGSVSRAMPIIEALGIVPKYSQSKKWSYDKLKKLLMNPIYIGMIEVNKKNKAKVQEALKPWNQFQIVRASWKPIIDDELFADVQEILEANYRMEHRRLENSERRVFLLSGILRCVECGRPLNGQSAHGKSKLHRYYAHSFKRNSLHNCSQKRIPANNIEQVVVNHLSVVMKQVGYFEGLRLRIEKAFVRPVEDLLGELKLAQKEIASIDKEVTSVIKMQLELRGQGNEAVALMGEHLESLGKQKKLLQNQISEIEEQLENKKDTNLIHNEIRMNIEDYQKGFNKAPDALRRRFVHKVIEKLVLTPNGLETYFRIPSLENERSSDGNKKADIPTSTFLLKNGFKSNLNGVEVDASCLMRKLLKPSIGARRGT